VTSVRRAVLDVDVLISAVLSPRGTPARLLAAWRVGEFELIVSPKLLGELRRALVHPKLVRLVGPDEAVAYVAWLARSAVLVVDPAEATPLRSEDPDDDYLLLLASAEDAVLVSGDAHLVSLAERAPISTPAEYLADLAGRRR
jgi:hypothetical protein